jgi:hypothetical protein
MGEKEVCQSQTKQRITTEIRQNEDWKKSPKTKKQLMAH